MTNNTDSIYRVIDANLNRLKEGLRVIEDIQRYIFNDKKNSKKLKELRHLSSSIDIEYSKLLEFRDTNSDVLKATTKSEASRTDLKSIQIANFKRVQESARVLEEILKLIDVNQAEIFKTIRYEAYNIEKELF
ncbi:MAG: Thiamine phosphate synthase [uncultured Campylobacterales bacterium]|uniref:Thiamine phosphate synthase n=1 Tax=uncultured Campylobacterales bacterium TaxID=352960 RepID=A0A6S6SIG4_9BACT|nr:MAG: Thiamine phosphate synthase [uncultured Campylobacterales bacterium]